MSEQSVNLGGVVAVRTNGVDEQGTDGRRPGLRLMPEFGVDVPVWWWAGGDGCGGPGEEGLLDLGVSRPLVDRLRAWHA